MSDAHRFLALDLGAESGRGIVVTLADGKVSMEEIHRFANRPVMMAGTRYWDLPFLFAEILQAIRLCAERKIAIESISVDTWGVDFGLLGGDGKLLGNPVQYRDSRTDCIHEYTNPTMSTGRIFELTGYEPWAISSLFQLMAMRRQGSPLLGLAETFLNMPDLFHYLLTGRKVSEMSIANTSNLMGTDGRWCDEIVRAFDLPAMFPDLVPPTTIVGTLRDDVCDQTGLSAVPVIATCGHDTSGVVAAVPGEGPDWAFLSSGTWSILGQVIPQPVATPTCLEHGFTNEYTIESWYLAKNIFGLWLVQELRRKWDTSQDPWDYPRMTAAAAKARTDAIFDASHPSLMAPTDMEEAILTLLKDSGQAAPSDRGQQIRCVLQSLALEYARGIDSLEVLTGTRPKSLYIVGGGTRNELLCQFTADACNMPVHAGADQCTALGNALGQALGLGILSGPEDIRTIMRTSFEMKRYEPTNPGDWQGLRERYAKLRG